MSATAESKYIILLLFVCFRDLHDDSIMYAEPSTPGWVDYTDMIGQNNSNWVDGVKNKASLTKPRLAHL